MVPERNTLPLKRSLEHSLDKYLPHQLLAEASAVTLLQVLPTIGRGTIIDK